MPRAVNLLKRISVSAGRLELKSTLLSLHLLKNLQHPYAGPGNEKRTLARLPATILRAIAVQLITNGTFSTRIKKRLQYKQRHSQPKKLRGANRLTLSKQEFWLGHRLSKHKMKRYARKLGGHDTLGPTLAAPMFIR